MADQLSLWVKHWWSWYTSRSHAHLEFDALHLGSFFACLAKASPEQPWLLKPNGQALTELELARQAKMPGVDRSIAKRMKTALQQLVDAQTMVRRDDGAYGFTDDGWTRYQVDTSWLRMANKRARDRGGGEESDGSVTPPVTEGVTAPLRSALQPPLRPRYGDRYGGSYGPVTPGVTETVTDLKILRSSDLQILKMRGERSEPRAGARDTHRGKIPTKEEAERAVAEHEAKEAQRRARAAAKRQERAR